MGDCGEEDPVGHKYICPICDGELKGMHYCKTCRKFIKEPWIFHGDSLPNQRSEKTYYTLDARSNKGLQRYYQENYGKTGGKLPYDTCHPVSGSGSYSARSVRQAAQEAARKAAEVAQKKPQQTGKTVVGVILGIWFFIVFFFAVLGALL